MADALQSGNYDGVGVPGRPLAGQLYPGTIPTLLYAGGFREQPDVGSIRGVYTQEREEAIAAEKEHSRMTERVNDSMDRANNASQAILELIGLNPEDFEDDMGAFDDAEVREELLKYKAGGGELTDAIKVAYRNAEDANNDFDKFNAVKDNTYLAVHRARDRWRDRMKRPPPAPHEADKEHSQRPGQRIDDTRRELGAMPSHAEGKTDPDAWIHALKRGKRQRVDRPPEGRRLEFGSLSPDG